MARSLGEGVFELGELDLDLGLVRGGAGGEDVEDEFGAVDDLALDDLLDVGDLAGGEIVVEDDHARIEGFAEGAELFDLAGAHVGRGGALGGPLLHLADDDCAGLLGQGAELAEGIDSVVGGVGEPDGGEHGSLRLDFDGGAFFGGGHNAANAEGAEEGRGTETRVGALRGCRRG